MYKEKDEEPLRRGERRLYNRSHDEGFDQDEESPLALNGCLSSTWRLPLTGLTAGQIIGR